MGFDVNVEDESDDNKEFDSDTADDDNEEIEY
jgi:hypothetical protein